MKLRNYQQASVDAVYDHLRRRDDNPVAVLPTGAGKSLVLAKIASDAVGKWGVAVQDHVASRGQRAFGNLRDRATQRFHPDIISHDQPVKTDIVRTSAMVSGESVAGASSMSL